MGNFAIFFATFAIGITIAYLVKCSERSLRLINTFICILMTIVIVLTTIRILEQPHKRDIVKALNGELQYDTLSLDKDGKLLEIKIK